MKVPLNMIIVRMRSFEHSAEMCSTRVKLKARFPSAVAAVAVPTPAPPTTEPWLLTWTATLPVGSLPVTVAFVGELVMKPLVVAAGRLGAPIAVKIL